MTKDEQNKIVVMQWFDELRQNQEFDTLKELRDRLRYLIRVSNVDWYALNKDESTHN